MRKWRRETLPPPSVIKTSPPSRWRDYVFEERASNKWRICWVINRSSFPSLKGSFSIFATSLNDIFWSSFCQTNFDDASGLLREFLYESKISLFNFIKVTPLTATQLIIYECCPWLIFYEWIYNCCCPECWTGPEPGFDWHHLAIILQMKITL